MTASREESFIGRRGQTIRFDVWEPAGAARGLLVISHGLGEHGRRYCHVAERMTAIGLRVAVPDHFGHGRSDGPRLAAKRFADYADDLGVVIDGEAVAAAPSFLLGHSMGGGIALDYALDHPNGLDGLILSGPTIVAGDNIPKPAQAVAKLLGRVVPSLPTAKLDSADISRDPAVVKSYDEDPLVYRGKIPAGLGGGLLAVMDSFPRRIPSLTLPVLVMHGSADKITEPDGSRLVVEQAGSTDKTLKIYDGLFHEIFNEPEKDVVLDDVAAWLTAHLPVVPPAPHRT